MVAFALVGIGAFLVYGRCIRNALAPEVFNLSYQFLLIVVIGGAVSLFYKEFSSERDRIQERHILLRQMHSELLSSYNAAKRVRRTLRACVEGSFDGESIEQPRIAAADYQKQMELLMDAQLAFEVYAKRAKDSELFFAQGEELGTECRKIEKYLNDVISEYEKNFTSFMGTPPGKPLKELPKLAEFIGPFQNADDFKTKFKDAFREVLSALTRAHLT